MFNNSTAPEDASITGNRLQHERNPNYASAGGMG